MKEEDVFTGDQEELVALLRRGSKAWNAWRKQQPEDVLIDLSEASFIGIQLPGADLHHVNLRHAIMRVDDNGSPLDCDFCGADLHGADLRWADMEMPKMRSACLNAADLREAKLNQPDLRQAHLKEANLSGARVRLGRFEGADLSGADLSGADLSGANLEQANLTGALLTGTNLTRACLKGACLRGIRSGGFCAPGADFSGADLRGVPWLLIMELTLQPGTRLDGIQWDRPEAAPAPVSSPSAEQTQETQRDR